MQNKMKVDNLYKANLLLSVCCKLHNICMERTLPEHTGRVMSDTYGDRTRNGDRWGGDWADWRIPDDEDDDTRIPVPRGKGKQRLRDELCENLARHNKQRPERSSYKPTHRRRRG